jgi:hypothetical protein
VPVPRLQVQAPSSLATVLSATYRRLRVRLDRRSARQNDRLVVARPFTPSADYTRDPEGIRDGVEGCWERVAVPVVESERGVLERDGPGCDIRDA